MTRSLPLLVFLVLNFGGLALGAQFTGPGVSSEWYQTLARAPWTPDGWVFGVAWTLIMFTFSIYMAKLWSLTEASDRPILAMAYIKALAFNIAWNPLFFGAQLTGWAMLDLVLLLAVVLWLWHRGWNKADMAHWRWLMLPYPCWLLVAISLNAYPLSVGV